MASPMAPDDLRLRFLKHGAQLLSSASPTAAATLGSARNRLLETQDADLEAARKEWDALRREVCGACGNLLLPGWSCEVSHRSRPGKLVDGAQEEDTLKNSNRKEKDMVYSCMRCGRQTFQSLPAGPSRRTATRNSKMRKLSPIADESSHRDQNKVIKSSNASSKQRAKARKGGLQAMLAQSKTQSPAQNGLDLMDFMQ